MAAAVKIKSEDHAILKELSTSTGLSMQELLSRSISKLERDVFFDEMDRRYAELKTDPAAWREYQAELSAWEALPDGLEDEPPYPVDEQTLGPAS